MMMVTILIHKHRRNNTQKKPQEENLLGLNPLPNSSE